MSANYLLYEINTIVYINNLSNLYNQKIDLSNIPEIEIEKLAKLGYSHVWLMGVWQRSQAAVEIELNDKPFMANMRSVLPDLSEEDIIGSAYSIKEYNVDIRLGGNESLAKFRSQLKKYNIGLILDFVPNHTAPDFELVNTSPLSYILGNANDLANDYDSFYKINNKVFAKGRDPQFEAWSDVLQLNAFDINYREFAVTTLNKIATMCDGVRCDMAMLMLNEIFSQNWTYRAGDIPKYDFWQYIIPRVKNNNPDFIFIAEAYWNTQSILLSQGFDYAYDKDIYDLILERGAKVICEHLQSTIDVRSKMLVFLENHDEQRAAAIMPLAKNLAAAAIVAFMPGIVMIHQGQQFGYKHHIPVHLRRGQQEIVQNDISNYYNLLLNIIKPIRKPDTEWQLIDSDNKKLIIFLLTNKQSKDYLIVNYSNDYTDLILTNEIPSSGTAKNLFDDNKYEIIDSVLKLKLEPWQPIILQFL